MIDLPKDDQACKNTQSNHYLALKFLQAKVRTKARVQKVPNQNKALKKAKPCISKKEIVGRTFGNWICFSQEMIHSGKCRYGFRCKKCGFSFYGLSKSSHMKVLHTCKGNKSHFHRTQAS